MCHISLPQALLGQLRQVDSHLLKHCLQHVLFGDSLDTTVGEHRRTFASSLQECPVRGFQSRLLRGAVTPWQGYEFRQSSSSWCLELWEEGSGLPSPAVLKAAARAAGGASEASSPLAGRPNQR